MKIEHDHREALLVELEKAQADLILQSKCLEDQTKTKGSLVEWFEISHFLAQQRIELIKKSIITSEIDY